MDYGQLHYVDFIIIVVLIGRSSTPKVGNKKEKKVAPLRIRLPTRKKKKDSVINVVIAVATH